MISIQTRITVDDEMVCSDGLYNEGNDTMMPIRNGGHINPELANSVARVSHVLPESSLENDRTIVKGLMRASQQTLSSLIEKEADIYTVADLKVRFR